MAAKEPGERGLRVRRGCFPARLVAAALASVAPPPASAARHLPFSSSSPPAPAPAAALLHELATTGSRVFPIFGRNISIYDFGVYVDTAALKNSASAGALRAAAPGALRAAAAVSSGSGSGGGSGKKKRKVAPLFPILPGLLERRRGARARRQQQQQRQQQQEKQQPIRNEGQSLQQQQQAPQQHPRAMATTFGEQLPSSEDLERHDPAMPFGAALRSADDVPMSLVVRSRCVPPFSLCYSFLSLRVVEQGERMRRENVYLPRRES